MRESDLTIVLVIGFLILAPVAMSASHAATPDAPLTAPDDSPAVLDSPPEQSGIGDRVETQPRPLAARGDDAAASDGNDATGNNTTDGAHVIIFFRNTTSRDAFANGAAAGAFSWLDRPGASIRGGQEVDFAPVLFATVPSDAIGAIEDRPGVATVLNDDRVAVETTALRGSPPAAPSKLNAEAGQTVPWGVARIGARDAAGAVPDAAERNVTVAVLDTGIDYTHPNLDDSVKWGANFSDGASAYGRSTGMDDQGHGTAVAGVLAAENDGTGVVGVAPKAEMYSIKVLNESGVGYASWLIEGIEAALEGPDGEIGTDDDADVLSISLSADNSSGALESAIDHAGKHAIVVAAAGNDGDGDPDTNEVRYPAKYSESIAVAATDTDDRTPPFSAEGDEIELAAPGVWVETTSLGGETIRFSGTSAATPHVSGAVALVIAGDLADGTRDLSNAEVRQRLRETALDIEEEGRDRQSGYGLIQADAALPNDLALGEIAGTVLTDAGNPVPGATVELHVDDSADPVATDSTADDGAYRFGGLETGRDYTIEATIGDRTGEATVTDLEAGTTIREVVLPPAKRPAVNVTVVGPKTVERGQEIDLQYAITNVGNGTAENGSIGLQVPRNVSVKNGTTQSLSGSLRPGETWTVNATLGIDGPFDGDDLQVGTMAHLGKDSKSQVTGFRLVQTRIHLDGPETIEVSAGETVNVTYTVRNTGTSRPSEGVVWIESLPDPLAVESNVTILLAGSEEVPAPNESTTGTFRIRVPNSTPAENYSIVSGGMLGADDPSEVQISGSTAVLGDSNVSQEGGVAVAATRSVMVLSEDEGTIVERYDTNGEAGIQAAELATAFEDWQRGEVTAQQLQAIFNGWKRT